MTRPMRRYVCTSMVWAPRCRWDAFLYSGRSADISLHASRSSADRSSGSGSVRASDKSFTASRSAGQTI